MTSASFVTACRIAVPTLLKSKWMSGLADRRDRVGVGRQPPQTELLLPVPEGERLSLDLTGRGWMGDQKERIGHADAWQFRHPPHQIPERPERDRRGGQWWRQLEPI